jgi:hypothetical protein
MSRRLTPAACAGALLAVASVFAAPARADLVGWSYSWSPASPSVAATTGSGSLSLSSEGTLAALGNSDVVATNVKSVSSALASSPDTFANAGYTLSMTLTDTASSQSTTLDFTGLLNGTVSSGSAHVTNAFTGLTTQTVTLGGNQYTVTLNSYLPPGPPSANNVGAFGASVTVVPGDDSVGEPNGVPEPSSLLLAGLGCSSLLALRFRRRRKAAQPA